MSDLLDKWWCSEHNCPMIDVGGDCYACLFDYVNERVGMRRVTDVVNDADRARLIFENGVELPLICPCCDKAIHATGGESLLKEVNGFRLETLEYAHGESQDKKKRYGLLLLGFTKNRKKKEIEVSLESAKQMTDERAMHDEEG